MRYRDVNRRLDRLEDRIYDFSFPPGTTKMSYECLTRKERILFERFAKIREKYGEDPPEDVCRENYDLVQAVSKIMWLRALDLFRSVVGGMVCKTGFDEAIFMIRLVGFMRETIWILERNRLEEAKIEQFFGDELYDEDVDVPDDNPRWKELEEYLARLDREAKAKIDKEMESAIKSRPQRVI